MPLMTSLPAVPCRALRSIALLAALLGLTLPRAAGAQLGIEVGAAAPDVALETLDGRPARLGAAIAGKPAVIEFWATWCSNCRELEPRMQAAQRKYAGRVAFVGVAVSVNQSPERVRRYVTEHLTGFTHFYDRRGDAVGDYDVPATSYVVVTDRTGKVVYTGLGGDQDIETAIQKALR
jgi:thiol-disulfide isomerase/thioredoxin